MRVRSSRRQRHPAVSSYCDTSVPLIISFQLYDTWRRSFANRPMAVLRPLRVRPLSHSQSSTQSSLQKAVPSFRLPWSSTTCTVRILSLQQSSGLFSATKRSDEVSIGRTDSRLYRSLCAVKVLLALLRFTLTVLASRGDRSLSVPVRRCVSFPKTIDLRGHIHHHFERKQRLLCTNNMIYASRIKWKATAPS